MIEKGIIVAGMKRSGHHGVINWIGHNLHCGTILYNDCKYGWDSKLLIPSDCQNEENKEIAIGLVTDVRNAIFNIEDFNPEWLNFYDFLNFKSISIFEEKYIIMIIRDPFNWIASCLKSGWWDEETMINKILIYIKQLEYFMENKYKPNNKLMLVDFDLWFINRAYRDLIANFLNFDNTEAGLNMLSTRGGGSSFDKLKYKNTAQKMDILNRWKYYSEDAFFQGLLSMIPKKYFKLFPLMKGFAL